MGAALPAAATTLAFVPELFWNPSVGVFPWGLAIAVAAPLASYLFNRRRPVAARLVGAVVVGLPQVPLMVALTLVDVWLDVRSGYLLAGSGEVPMAVAFGSIFAVGFGVVLAVLVAAAGWSAASRRS